MFEAHVFIQHLKSADHQYQWIIDLNRSEDLNDNAPQMTISSDVFHQNCYSIMLIFKNQR